jgi:hypothetical protein
MAAFEPFKIETETEIEIERRYSDVCLLAEKVCVSHRYPYR